MWLGLQLLGVTAAGLGLCYGVGTGLVRAVRPAIDEPFFGLFLRLLSGLTVLASVYAIFQTRGATILLPLLLLLLAALYALRTAETTALLPAGEQHRYWGWVLAMGAVLFVGRFCLLYEPGADFLQTPYHDYVYYSRLTLPLNELGIETNSLEVVYPQFQTAQPYHYYGLWLNALAVRLTGLPSVWVYYLGVASVLLTVCAVGFAAIYAHYGLRPGWAAVLGGASLTATGTYWPFLMRFPAIANGSLLAHTPLILQPKTGSIYLFALLSTLLLVQRRYRAFGLALAMVPLTFISTAAAIGMGAAGLAAYLWASGKASLRQALAVLLPTVAAELYLLLFYLLRPEPFQFAGAERQVALATIIPPANEWRLVFNIFLGTLLTYALYYIGYAAVIAGLSWRKDRLAAAVAHAPLLTWGGATILGAALTRAVSHHFLDSFQFFSNPIVPLSAAAVAIGLGWAVQNANALQRVLALAGLAGLALLNARVDTTSNSRFSSSFLRQVGPVLRALPNRGGYLLADAEYENAYMLWADSYTAGAYVSNFKNDYLLLSLSALVPDSLDTDPRFSHNATEAGHALRNTTLYRLAQLRRLAGRPVPPDSLPLAMVRHARLAFICASRQAMLPASLRPVVRASYHDATSGETLYVLKPLAQEPTTGHPAE